MRCTHWVSIAGEVVHQRECRRHRLGIAGEACSEFCERMCTGGDSVNRPHAWRVIEIANEYGALGWKVEWRWR